MVPEKNLKMEKQNYIIETERNGMTYMKKIGKNFGYQDLKKKYEESCKNQIA